MSITSPSLKPVTDQLVTLNTETVSIDDRLATLNTETVSIDDRLATLNTETVSIDARLTTLNTETVSIDARLTTLNTETASIDDRLTTLNTTATAINTQGQTIETTHHNAVTANGNGTRLIVPATRPISTVVVSVSGTAGGATLTPQMSGPTASSWATCRAWNMTTSEWVSNLQPIGAFPTSFVIPLGTAKEFRVVISGYTSGTWTVTSLASDVPFTAPLDIETSIKSLDTLLSDAITPVTATLHSAVTANAVGTEMTITPQVRTIYLGVIGAVDGATLTPEVRGPAGANNNWTAVRVWDVAAQAWTSTVTGALNAKIFLIPATMTTEFRCRITDYASGTWTVVATASTQGFDAPQIIEPRLDTLITSVDALDAPLSAIQLAVEDSSTHHTPVGSHGTTGTLTTAVTVTPFLGATKMLIQAFGGPVRYRLDGVNPTASTGFRLAENERAEIPLAAGAELRLIQESAAATVQYQAVA